MKSKLKLLSIITALFFLSNRMNAQVQWQFSQNVGNVDCFFKLTTCDTDTVVFIKFVNNNNTNVTIRWKEIFDTQFELGVAGFLGPKEMLLSPGLTEKTDCSTATNPGCLVLPWQVHPTYVSKIRGFRFSEVVVE